jgi:hypothetical protein
LLIIFHDPPETMNLPDPDATGLEPHNIVINDVAQDYVRQAIESGFSVIDVNVPTHLTGLEDNTDSTDYRTSVTNEVASYLWENYIEVHEHSHIFLLGIGSAAFAMIHILNSHESTNNSVSLAASFVAQNMLQGVTRPADDFFPAWYYSNSIVWVAENHGVWSPDRQRKLRKKYGRLEKSSSTSINDMLVEHQAEFFARLAKKMAPPPEAARAPVPAPPPFLPVEEPIPPAAAASSFQGAPGLAINGATARGDESGYASGYAADTSSLGGADGGNALMEGVVNTSAAPVKSQSPTPALQQEYRVPSPFAALQQAIQQPTESPPTVVASPIRSPERSPLPPTNDFYPGFQGSYPSQ